VARLTGGVTVVSQCSPEGRESGIKGPSSGGAERDILHWPQRQFDSNILGPFEVRRHTPPWANGRQTEDVPIPLRVALPLPSSQTRERRKTPELILMGLRQ
jgi:hypothetical protein